MTAPEDLSENDEPLADAVVRAFESGERFALPATLTLADGVTRDVVVPFVLDAGEPVIGPLIDPNGTLVNLPPGAALRFDVADAFGYRVDVDDPLDVEDGGL